MSKPIPYQMTNESITVVIDGKSRAVQKGTSNFAGLKKAIEEERWDDIPNYVTVAKSLESWAKGRFTLRGGSFLFDGAPVPDSINGRIINMATNGEDPTRFFKFWERLQKNPSSRSVSQCFNFLEHQHIPLDKNGFILAYKSVKEDYRDHHSGKFDNHPGNIIEMPRNQVSDDPHEACEPGFHVGSRSFAKSFGSGRLLITQIDPQDVVSVPYDASQQKMRVCKYKVLGHDNGEPLPDTSFDEELSDGDEKPTQVQKVGKAKVRSVEPKMNKPARSRDLKIDYGKIHKMTTTEILLVGIDDLRRYACNYLKITGANKIPGGKVTLLKRISEVRTGADDRTV